MNSIKSRSLFLKIYLVGVGGRHRHAMWRSKDNLQTLVLSFHRVGPEVRLRLSETTHWPNLLLLKMSDIVCVGVRRWGLYLAIFAFALVTWKEQLGTFISYFCSAYVANLEIGPFILLRC